MYIGTYVGLSHSESELNVANERLNVFIFFLCFVSCGTGGMLPYILHNNGIAKRVRGGSGSVDGVALFLSLQFKSC